MARGRKRRFNPDIPGHIDQDSLPAGIHWHVARQVWYVTYKDETGKPKTKVVADRYSKLSDLHKQIEHFSPSESGQSYKWLSSKYQKSADFSDLKPLTKRDYLYSSGLIEDYITLSGKKLGDLDLSGWNTPMMVKLIDKIGESRGRSAANHALRFTKVLFRWGKNRGFIPENYADGIKQLKEKPKQQYVPDPIYYKVLDYARACGSMPQQEKHSCPFYLWAIMEIAYLCRLRGIEVVNLREGFAVDGWLRCTRAKGSRENQVAFNRRLQIAWDYLITERNRIWKAKSYPVPIDPMDRPILVSKSGMPLEKSSLDTSWQRFITVAIGAEIITTGERFSLHDLKRKGISDTPGNRSDKQEASGHRSERMMDTYDKSVAKVQPSSE